MSQPTAAIAGLGITEQGKVYGKTAQQFAAQAVRLAAADAGLELSDIDGLLVSGGLKGRVGIELQQQLGLTDLRLLTQMQGYGSTAGQMVQYASMAVQSGMVDTVAIVWADAPLKEKGSSSAAYSGSRRMPRGFDGITASNGIMSPTTMYALAARRHMKKYGTTNDHFGAIAVAQREWAQMNPIAQFYGTPLTLEEYHASRYIAEPFHLYDCCLVSNGGVALIVTSLERARTLRQPPVRVLGWAQAHPGRSGIRNDDFGLVSGAAQSGPAALKMAQTSLDEIGVAQIYDCYTFTALLTLEDYGFVPKGEGGPALSEPGMIGPNGKLKLNTGGGELSAFYMWGMTPLHEAVVQARGQGGERQVENHDRVLVSGNGGILDYHSTLVLGTDN
ncbi:acetyl-CoA acetyltransferase [Mycolicibacterium phlei]|uniref:Sterol carrier protein n=1 Tax=Mycolicibacterium phlei DSM 43239 = CCUG 21000 TaxID=1226750 RepID=A0A5N5V0S4_MYCPH|nr:thiolase family protein [Mycolicibacterium phlei]VEG11964.1 acetyl-CoA acetyltransferase [Mycobacteroides chelonae]AMO63875.1 thiolase [Mycolicibacterium phlei]KAB7754737.1 sterol carrier protein [Mycolicibacterium phlei DSM 43239 = CCUG 21000]KXW65382.1 sterol carrier protein [Mycolicibacterium phlei DSM 43239 = CCUG 21000]KXW69504.1 sterol carrier protein [Mycolicibacterium phlei DSM 43070]